MGGTFGSGPVRSLAETIPGLLEGSGSVGSKVTIQKNIVVPLGPPLLVDGATYKGVAFIAPCNGCMIKEIWIAAAVAPAGGTNTLNFDNYDASANAARAATTEHAVVGLTAKEGTKLTVSTTQSNLLMDEGDVLNFTLVCGTQTVNGEGLTANVIVAVPEIVV